MLTNRRAKDQEMASRMKKEGVRRSSARCPICHSLIAMNSLYFHICSCKGIHIRVCTNENRRGR